MNTEKKLWFKAKRYGYGWVPCSYEGWLVLLMYILFLFTDALLLDKHSHSASDTVRPFLVHVVLATALLLFICYRKGEKPGWR